VELLPEIISVILKEKNSGKIHYLTGCKSRNVDHVNVVVEVGVVGILILAVVLSVLVAVLTVVLVVVVGVGIIV
jgi:hypothetical protein